MIYIIDSLMGTGKTKGSYSMINRHKDRKYVFMTPLLNEFKPLQHACRDLYFIEPQAYPTKQAHFRSLVQSGQNIVTSHELIKRMKFTDEDKAIFYSHRYTLIIDEAVDTISEFSHLNLADFKKVKDDIQIDSRGWVTWTENDESKIPDRYRDVYEVSLTGNLYSYNNTLLWRLPLDFFDCFQDIYIMTYNFERSHMSYDLKLENIPYEYCHFENNELQTGKQDISHYLQAFKDRIVLYDGKLNEIGKNYYDLSAHQWKSMITRSSMQKTVSVTEKHIYIEDTLEKFRNIFRNHNQPVDKCIYSRFKRPEETTNGQNTRLKYFIRNYTGAEMVPFNTTGTNEYRLKTSLIYGVNVFEHPGISQYYQERHLSSYNKDDMALNTMLQWIYRSAIRNVNVEKTDPCYHIMLAVPSLRMRNILLQWVNQ